MTLRSRRIAAVLVAAALGTTAAVRVAAVGQSLDVRVWRSAANPSFAVWNVMVTSRGGEPVDEVAIETVLGPVTLSGGTSMKDLAPGWRVSFEVRLESTAPTGVVRIVQKGRDAQTYDVTVGEAP